MSLYLKGYRQDYQKGWISAQNCHFKVMLGLVEKKFPSSGDRAHRVCHFQLKNSGRADQVSKSVHPSSPPQPISWGWWDQTKIDNVRIFFEIDLSLCKNGIKMDVLSYTRAELAT